ncbi:MAG: holo-ACP synthase [Magnetococcales bacterium]|nr:holo-ACP synthase [Magnetococcales bacterium]
MILGIGTDIVKVVRLERSVARFGQRFIQKILNQREIEHCNPGPGFSACLARRFAAKEALAKALGTGMSQGVWFTDIEIIHTTAGKPGFLFSGETQKKLAALAPLNVHLSISDEREFAVAFVILETDP